jgi:hypothetical protein
MADAPNLATSLGRPHDRRVFSTCIFCHQPLGGNAVVEHFTVGARLAFDAAKGRLWAICPNCARWNLSPLDERWDAIEECERLYRETKQRVSTENVGLARVRDGTTLVRIGNPLRPEMAAWRYGDQFGRRRARRMLGFGALGLSVGALFAAGPVAALASMAVIVGTKRGRSLLDAWASVRVPSPNGLLHVSRSQVERIAIHSDPSARWALEVPHRMRTFTSLRDVAANFGEQTTLLRGDDAIRVARVIFPKMNEYGGASRRVAEAVSVLEEAPDAARILTLVGRRERVSSVRWSHYDPGEGQALRGLHPSLRLAIEMALHEEDERRAMEGELAELRDRWEEAEEIAAIADNLFTSNIILPRYPAPVR